MHVDGKKNVVADVLSRKPQVSAVSIVFHDALDEMKDQYAHDEEFGRIYDQLENGDQHARDPGPHIYLSLFIF